MKQQTGTAVPAATLRDGRFGHVLAQNISIIVIEVSKRHTSYASFFLSLERLFIPRYRALSKRGREGGRESDARHQAAWHRRFVFLRLPPSLRVNLVSGPPHPAAAAASSRSVRLVFRGGLTEEDPLATGPSVHYTPFINHPQCHITSWISL